MTGAVIIAIVLVFVALIIARMIWRFVRGDMEIEEGGSLGRQFFGRHSDDKPDDLV